MLSPVVDLSLFFYDLLGTVRPDLSLNPKTECVFIVMNKLTPLFLAILLLIQYPLWFGKGGWAHLDDVARQLERQEALNTQLKRRNAQLSAEVWDLKRGTESIEERARFEFGLIKSHEELFQFVGGS